MEHLCPHLDLDPDLFTPVLVLYTGGTIGMKNVNGALAPMPNFMEQSIRSLPMFHDKEKAAELGLKEREGQPLIMPLSEQGKHVIYKILEYNPLLDSSNMSMDDWSRLAVDIQKHYYDYDAFVVLHGTDTMAYTASALSFMIEHLGKSVIVTGSQIPVFETRGDGRDNFLGALVMAGHYNIPEVTVFFNNKLMRGNRTIKKNADAFDAFESPNLPPLASLEVNIFVDWEMVFRPCTLEKMSLLSNVCPHVGLLRFFPSITAETISQFLSHPIQGVVLQTYGAGNGPDARKDLLHLFKEATNRGVLILNITQCTRGVVSDTYAAGQALLDVGIIPGYDMTPEAAFTKLSYVLGKTEWDLATKKTKLGENLRGEITVTEAPGEGSQTELEDLALLDKMKECLRLTYEEEIRMLRSSVYPPLIFKAAQGGDLESLHKLEDAGAVLCCADADGRTPLHVASSEGHLDVVKYLLQNGALVHKRDRYGNNALDDAVQFDHHEVIQLLVNTGARLSMSKFKRGSELCMLASRGYIESLKSFKEAGVDLNQADFDGRTALHLAVSHGKKEVVEFLVECGVDVLVEDHFGNTPAQEANRPGHHDILNILNNINNPN